MERGLVYGMSGRLPERMKRDGYVVFEGSQKVVCPQFSRHCDMIPYG